MTSVVMICSFTDEEKLLDYRKIPNNVFLFGRVPQIVALKHSDLFVTHGGLGSIKESIECEVPMLAYPFTEKWDSNGNSSKIAHHGLGLRGNIHNDSLQQIRSKIQSIFNDSSFKQRVLALKTKTQEKYKEGIFLKLVEGIRENEASI